MSKGFASKYQSGDRIDERYKVVRLLGAGGMAEVYLVQDSEMHDKEIALKLLFPHVSVNEINVERFIREVDLTRKLNHPNIVKSYHYGKTAKSEQYFTMEFIDGRSLAEELHDVKKLNAEKACDYLMQIAEGLSAAHNSGVIHRDIKPENILISKDGEIKITDFGIAKDLKSDQKLTELEKGPKSYLYKAPELYVEEYDLKVDIYAFGIMAYELLTGEPPFKGEPHQLLAAHLTQPIPKFAGDASEIPLLFQGLVEKCTAKNPKERYSRMEDVIKGIALIKAESHRGSFLQRLIYKLEYEFRVPAPRLMNFMLALFYAFLLVFLFTPSSNIPYSGRLEGLINFPVLDTFFKLAPTPPPPNEIVIVKLDDESFAKLNAASKSIMPREYVAAVINKISTFKPREVIIDIQFNDLIESATDETLKEAIRNAGAYIAKLSKIGPDGVKSDILPNELFLSAAKGAFNSALKISPHDGKIRTFYYEPDFEKHKFVPPLSEVRYGKDVGPNDLPYPGDMIRFYGPPNSIKSVSFASVLTESPERMKSIFENKFVFLGVDRLIPDSANPLDRQRTPFPGTTSGVEIHATVFGNIINKEWIRRIRVDYEEILLPLLFINIFYLAINLSKRKREFILVITAMLWVLMSFILFCFNIYLPPSGLALMLLLGFIPIRARSFEDKARDNFFEV